MVLLQQTAQDIFYVTVIDVIIKWRDTVGSDSSFVQTAVALAQAIAGIFAYIYMAIRLYPIIAGDEKLSIVPLLRPFAIGFAIMFWGGVVDVCKIPGQALEKAAQTEFYTTWNELRAKTKERYVYVKDIHDTVMKVGTYVERAEDSERSTQMQASDISKSSGWDILGIGNRLAAMRALVMNQLRYIMFSIIEFLCLLFMNVVVCGVFFMQSLAYLILIILGPLAFAFSVLDVWKKSWAQWVARFFSVTLWSGLAYLICWAGANIMTTLVDIEIQALQELVDKGLWGAAMFSSLASMDNFLFPLMCLFVAFGMLLIFPVSTWIIQTSGAASIITTPANAAGQTVATVGGFALGGKIASK